MTEQVTFPILKKIKEINLPHELTRQGASEILASAKLGVIEKLSQPVSEILEILESEEINAPIESGHLTLAMIRPRLHEAIEPGSLQVAFHGDPELEQALRESIESPLESLFSLSFTMTEEMVETFYAGKPKASQINIPPLDSKRYGLEHSTRWDEFKTLMTIDPVTFVLLYSPEGNASENWRNQMGDNWNVREIREEYPDSLRAKLALDNHNNLLHGSDNPESVVKEIKFIADALSNIMS